MKPGWGGRVVQAAWGRNHDVTAYNLGIRADSTRAIRRRWRAETMTIGEEEDCTIAFVVDDA